MDPAAISRAAALLGKARLSSAPVPDIPAADRPPSEAAAYDVQDALHDFLADAGQGERVGWKVGATTAGMQSYLGVDGPAWGGIFATNVHADGAVLEAAAFCNPGIECEIAVRMGRDAEATTYDAGSVSALIADVFPAIEIVENRYGDFLARGTPTLIADDFFHKAIVTGQPVADWRSVDLAAVTGRTVVDGTEKGSGIGADVLGHPLNAVAWLANALRARGRRLSAGDIVMTGSLPPVIWLESLPAAARIEIGSLGGVSVSFR